MQAINLKEKEVEKELLRGRKSFALLISDEHMNDVIKIIKPLIDLVVLIDGVTETVKTYDSKKINKADLLELC